jgi:glycosyltransferase involved in cell wall biosynthesis
MPVFNGGKYLQLSIESVLSQSLKNFEFLILDDCSSDGSWEYINNCNDQRITVYKNQFNQGLFYNLNYLIGRSKSTLIKLWAQDDIMYPNCLESFVAFHQKHQAIGFSYSGRDIIDKKGIVKKQDLIDNTPAIITSELHAKIAFFTGSIAGNIANVCIHKKALEKVGLFNEEMKISADFDMWVRLAKEYDTGFIADKLIRLRDHEGQLSRNENYYLKHVKEDMVVYRNLLTYVSPQMRTEGKTLLREYKFVFYYTLMVKSLLKFKLTTGYKFYKELCAMDNFAKLTRAFLFSKLGFIRKPDWLN